MEAKVFPSGYRLYLVVGVSAGVVAEEETGVIANERWLGMKRALSAIMASSTMILYW